MTTLRIAIAIGPGLGDHFVDRPETDNEGYEV